MSAPLCSPPAPARPLRALLRCAPPRPAPPLAVASTGRVQFGRPGARRPRPATPAAAPASPPPLRDRLPRGSASAPRCRALHLAVPAVAWVTAVLRPAGDRPRPAAIPCARAGLAPSPPACATTTPPAFGRRRPRPAAPCSPAARLGRGHASGRPRPRSRVAARRPSPSRSPRRPDRRRHRSSPPASILYAAVPAIPLDPRCHEPYTPSERSPLLSPCPGSAAPRSPPLRPAAASAPPLAVASTGRVQFGRPGARRPRPTTPAAAPASPPPLRDRLPRGSASAPRCRAPHLAVPAVAWVAAVLRPAGDRPRPAAIPCARAGLAPSPPACAPRRLPPSAAAGPAPPHLARRRRALAAATPRACAREPWRAEEKLTVSRHTRSIGLRIFL
nr:vegetative cell wall protein gp1-like [Aegilops tauschii subsp. strangulata]